MGVVNLARVDERLIHGQVMVTLSQKSGVNSIFVVDEVVAKDLRLSKTRNPHGRIEYWRDCSKKS